MKVKLLKKLRKKFCIMSLDVHVFKILYSVKTLHIGGEDYCQFCSYSFKEALKKQRELIIKELKKIQNK